MRKAVMIRAGDEADREWCARMMAGSEPWNTLHQDLPACQEKMRRPGTQFFVAADAKRRLGFILLAEHGFAGMPYVSSIGVAADARGNGIGRTLLKFAEQHYAGRGRIFLLVSSFNHLAQKFYKREGYEFLGELKDFVVPGHSEMIFAKKVG